MQLAHTAMHLLHVTEYMPGRTESLTVPMDERHVRAGQTYPETYPVPVPVTATRAPASRVGSRYQRLVNALQRPS
jgi:hypothetical protein